MAVVADMDEAERIALFQTYRDLVRNTKTALFFKTALGMLMPFVLLHSQVPLRSMASQKQKWAYAHRASA